MKYSDLLLLFLCSFPSLSLCASSSPSFPSSSSSLSFNEITSITCKSSFPPQQHNYTLTIPSWPASSPAQNFVLQITGSLIGINVYASNSSDVSNINYYWGLQTSSVYSVGEVWVPQQDEGTVIYVLVVCGYTSNFTLEPVIPQAFPNNPMNGFLTAAPPTDGHAYWYAYQLASPSMFASIKTEACSASATLLRARVVFPNIVENSGACTGVLSGSTNCEFLFTVSSVFSVSTLSRGGSLFYITGGSIGNGVSTTTIPINHLLATDQSGVLWTMLQDTVPSTALKVARDLFVFSSSNGFFPTDINNMKFYYTTKSGDSNAAFFSSSCFLRSSVGAQYNSNVAIKNATTDDQLLLSSMSGIKMQDFFSDVGFVTNLGYSVLINNYVTVAGSGVSSLYIENYSNGMLIGLIVVSIVCGLYMIATIIGFSFYRKRYQPIM